MKAIFIFLLSMLLAGSATISGQEIQNISTYDFVQIVDDNQEEAMFYYENNWQKARELGVNKGFIESFQLLEITPSEETPFHLILVTTYKDSLQYRLREENFEELFAIRGELKLLNQKKPGDFRKIIHGTESTRHRRIKEN
ncbi:MAG: hypothetical protein HKN45_00010 [Flavobacteriales bacterium]|nr:hypothetical protein [Flavobacteriales bacterium]